MLDIGLLHHLEELARVGAQALDVAPLPLGIDGVEREARLARARQAGDHGQPVARDVDVDALEVVLARAADGDMGQHKGVLFQICSDYAGRPPGQRGTAYVGASPANCQRPASYARATGLPWMSDATKNKGSKRTAFDKSALSARYRHAELTTDAEMPSMEQAFAISLEEFARQFPGEFGFAEKLERIPEAYWIDEHGRQIEPAPTQQVVLPPAEIATGDAEISASAGPALIVNATAAPADARFIRFEQPDRAVTFDLLEDASPWTTERTTASFGAQSDRFEIRIFSELFADFGRFEAHVDEFYLALRQVDPFTRVDAAGKLRVIGHYATSPGAGGHFRTVPSGNASERRILGNQTYARQRLSHLLGTMPALILIDSPVGGGAGGALANGRPYWPSWASIAPMNGGVPWILVAIHELAHAFGLSDEYIDDKIRDDRLPPRYDNVSNAVRAADLPWNDLANLPAETALPTNENDGTPIDGAPTGPLAAFRGAYYRNHHWRPTRDCRMRNYRPDGFCAVCSRIILKHFAMQ